MKSGPCVLKRLAETQKRIKAIVKSDSKVTSLGPQGQSDSKVTQKCAEMGSEVTFESLLGHFGVTLGWGLGVTFGSLSAVTLILVLGFCRLYRAFPLTSQSRTDMFCLPDVGGQTKTEMRHVCLKLWQIHYGRLIKRDSGKKSKRIFSIKKGFFRTRSERGRQFSMNLRALVRVSRQERQFQW